MVCRGPSLFFRTVVPPFLSFLLPALFSASRVFPLSDAGLPSAAFHAHSFPGGFFSLFLFFRLRSVWRFRLPVPFSLRLFPHFARSASGYFPSSFGLALPVSGFRLRLVLSRIIRLHVWRYVSRRGLRGTTMPTAQAVPVAHAAASADRAEPENRPERPLPSGPKLRAAAASVLPSGGRIPVVLLASGASVCRLRQERRRQSGMVRFQRLKAVP